MISESDSSEGGVNYVAWVQSGLSKGFALISLSPLLIENTRILSPLQNRNYNAQHQKASHSTKSSQISHKNGNSKQETIHLLHSDPVDSILFPSSLSYKVYCLKHAPTKNQGICSNSTSENQDDHHLRVEESEDRNKLSGNLGIQNSITQPWLGPSCGRCENHESDRSLWS